MTLVLENISKVVRGETHLYPTDLTLEPGSFNVLLGRTLAGKTSLMRIMASLDQPTTGRVLENGNDVTKVPVRNRSLAMVYQQFINYPGMTVFDNIASPLRISGRPKEEIKRRVGEMAELLHIEKLLDRMPAELSGGQQQRCALARALVRDARLLLLDEPLVNLDYKLREELREELRNLLAERDAVVVYATTEPAEALILGGNTGVLYEGQLLQYGHTVETFLEPKDLRVARVFNDPPMNMVPGQLKDDRLSLEDGHDLPVPPHLSQLPEGRYQIGVRPHHLGHDEPGGDAIPIHGRCELVEISGSTSFIYMHQGGFEWVAQKDGVHNIPMGDDVHMNVKPSHLYAFDDNGELAAAPARIASGEA